MKDLFQKNKKAILFLAKFLGTYAVLSVIYGFYISQYNTQTPPVADGVTWMISEQVVAFLNWFGLSAEYGEIVNTPAVQLYLDGKQTVSVFEGCNGLNIMILCLAFIVAFGGNKKAMFWYIPASIIFIHVANVLRIAMLAYIFIYHNQGFHFFHKFVFTAVIYAAIFIIWLVWVKYFGTKIPKNHTEVPKKINN